jgi:hypothetical protein
LPTTLLSDNQCLYNCNPTTAINIQLQLPGLHLFTNTKARIGVATQRNSFSNSTIAVNPVFTLPATVFSWPAEAAKPSLQNNASITIVSSDLQNCFNDLISPATEVLLKINLSYQYEIAPGLPTTLPVTLLPAVPWNGEVISNMLTAANTWLQQQQPAKGLFVMDTTISTLEKRELMRISEVRFVIE